MPQNTTTITLSAVVPDYLSGKRLDRAAAILFPDYSRGRLKSWIQSGALTLNDAETKPRQAVAAGDALHVEAVLTEESDTSAEAIPLFPIFEDDALLIINKPAGLVVHPGAGQPNGTLQNALLFHDPSLAAVPRAGIVHRLDKDTSGIMVVAKTLAAHHHLVQQLQARDMKRLYFAICVGKMTGGGRIEAPIGRHPVKRTRMAVSDKGKPAVTHYRLLKNFGHHALVSVALESGRTHQIRVHMAHRRYPLIGDKTYGGRLRLPKGVTEALRDALQEFPRQALHAYQLSLVHPETKQQMTWTLPMPNDLAQLVVTLEAG